MGDAGDFSLCKLSYNSTFASSACLVDKGRFFLYLLNMLPIEFSKYIQLIKFKMTHKVNLQLSEFSKTRGSPRNPCHG